MLIEVDAMDYQTRATLVAVLDDDALICNSIADLLLSAGIESRTFASAETFLASCEFHEIACLARIIHEGTASGCCEREIAAKLRS